MTLIVSLNTSSKTTFFQFRFFNLKKYSHKGSIIYSITFDYTNSNSIVVASFLTSIAMHFKYVKINALLPLKNMYNSEK